MRWEGAKPVRLDLPPDAVAAGFENDPPGTHTSRTIMLADLRALLGSTDHDADYEDYRNAAVLENAVNKATTPNSRTVLLANRLTGGRGRWLHPQVVFSIPIPAVGARPGPLRRLNQRVAIGARGG